MNRSSYESKLEAILGDKEKFQPCSPDQNDRIKTKINSISNKYKVSHPHVYKKLRVLGESPPVIYMGCRKFTKALLIPHCGPL